MITAKIKFIKKNEPNITNVIVYNPEKKGRSASIRLYI